MRHLRAWGILGVLFVPSLAAAQVVGRLAAVQGEVRIERGGVATPAQVGAALSLGDVLSTGTSGRAKLLLEDGSVLNVGDESRLKLTRFLLDPARGRTGLFELVRGSVRAWVSKLRGKSRFDVQTPTAVAGVRGTDYAVRELEQGAQVVVFGGEVVVRSSVEGVAGQCVAQGGMACEVMRGQPPGAPAAVPGDLLQTVKDATQVSARIGNEGVRFARELSGRMRGLATFGPSFQAFAERGDRMAGLDRNRNVSDRRGLPGENGPVRDTILPTRFINMTVNARVPGSY